MWIYVHSGMSSKDAEPKLESKRGDIPQNAPSAEPARTPSTPSRTSLRTSTDSSRSEPAYGTSNPKHSNGIRFSDEGAAEQSPLHSSESPCHTAENRYGTTYYMPGTAAAGRQASDPLPAPGKGDGGHAIDPSARKPADAPKKTHAKTSDKSHVSASEYDTVGTPILTSNAPRTFSATASGKPAEKTSHRKSAATATKNHSFTAQSAAKTTAGVSALPKLQKRYALCYAVGTFGGGCICALASAEDLTLLHYFTQQLLQLGERQPFEVFVRLFVPALLQALAVAVCSVCAVGELLMAALLALCGAGAGAAALAFFIEYGLSGLLAYVLLIGLYQAFLAAALCILSQSGAKTAAALLSGLLPGKRTADPHGSHSPFHLVRTHLCAAVVLLLLCGFFAVTSQLSRQAVIQFM